MSTSSPQQQAAPATTDNTDAGAQSQVLAVPAPAFTPRPVLSGVELEKRWRLILGKEGGESMECQLTTEQQAMDAALEALYEGSGISDDEDDSGSGSGRSRRRRGGRGGPAPKA